jgi:hypothetical protein
VIQFQRRPPPAPPRECVAMVCRDGVGARLVSILWVRSI